MAGPRFVVARNPDADSSLPYVLRLPVGGSSGLVLKAAEPWPVASRVYCHRLESLPGELDVLEDVGVRMCAWRGRALDLVLDRARHNRSQFVWTTARGRAAIFWQTPLVARRRRASVPPAPRRAGEFAIEVDTRERRPYDFGGRASSLHAVALFAGDYAVRGPDGVLAAVERKTADDFVSAATSGALAFAMADLSALPAAAVVVEEHYSGLIAHPRVRPAFMADLLVRLQVRAPNVPIVYGENRRMAEDWTYRFLETAWRELGGGGVAGAARLAGLAGYG
jgi:hypothetical protein